MRTALVFSDLHANKRALREITPVLNQVDISIFCGDLLGYGKDIDYCIDFILNNVDLVVLGNHERLATTNESLEKQLPVIRESTIFTRSKLSRKQIDAISSLPTEIYCEDMYITHSINDEYLTSEQDFKRLYERMNTAKYAFFGHTHEQVLYKNNNKIIINPGSITKGRRGFQRSYVIIRDHNIEFVTLEDIL